MLFRSCLVVIFTSFLVGSAIAKDRFPLSPDPHLTPGSLCADPDGRRYPERVDVCSRSVNVETKEEIVDLYDRKLGYQIRVMGRRSFKIDHFIPLCMGGSNEMDNLWPQHYSVYELTDKLEEICCLVMEEGRLKQADAIDYIRRGKSDPENAPHLTEEVRGLSSQTYF